MPRAGSLPDVSASMDRAACSTLTSGSWLESGSMAEDLLRPLLVAAGAQGPPTTDPAAPGSAPECLPCFTVLDMALASSIAAAAAAAEQPLDLPQHPADSGDDIELGLLRFTGPAALLLVQLLLPKVAWVFRSVLCRDACSPAGHTEDAEDEVILGSV